MNNTLVQTQVGRVSYVPEFPYDQGVWRGGIHLQKTSITPSSLVTCGPRGVMGQMGLPLVALVTGPWRWDIWQPGGLHTLCINQEVGFVSSPTCTVRTVKIGNWLVYASTSGHQSLDLYVCTWKDHPHRESQVCKYIHRHMYLSCWEHTWIWDCPWYQAGRSKIGVILRIE